MAVPQTPSVVAAGAVVFGPGKRVLLVHRPKYDDWSFPKGKLDRGEHAAAAAVREVAEETGLHVRLGPPLPDQHYVVGQGPKVVHYWVGRVVGPDDVSGYRPNEEIDQVGWVPLAEAEDLLTYDRDRDTLAQAAPRRRKTRALVVLRHAQARSRRSWRGDDRQRTLLQTGHGQAQRLVPLLAAYDVTRVVSSTSTRCIETVTPYLQTTGWPMQTCPLLSEEQAGRKAVRRVVGEVVEEVEAGVGAVVCTHRPVLPWVFDALDLEPVELDPAEMLVVHLRRGTVVSTERHRAG